MSLDVGKLPPDLLRKWLSRVPVHDPRVVVGARYGEDAAVIDIGDSFLVAKTDPITFTADRLGWYALNINANDVATMGARPRWFLAALLLPAGAATARLADSIFEDILGACDELGVTLCGGHTEVTAAVRQPVLVGHMLGETQGRRLMTLQSARPGDAVLLTKGVAIEGTAIIAREKGDEVRHTFGEPFRRRAAAFLEHPGISVVREALIAADIEGVRAMHDPTEGGLAEGLAELAAAAACGLKVREDAIRIYPETAALCRDYQLDPLGLIASGALLIVAEPEAVPAVARALEKADVECAVIGRLTSEPDLVMVREGRAEPLAHSHVDQITRVL